MSNQIKLLQLKKNFKITNFSKIPLIIWDFFFKNRNRFQIIFPNQVNYNHNDSIYTMMYETYLIFVSQYRFLFSGIQRFISIIRYRK